MSQGKGFLPVYVEKPHFIVGFGAVRIIRIRFCAKPSCPHFISEAGIQCAASCIDTVKESYFHGGGVHGLYGDFHIVDEVMGVSFGKARVPAVFFIFGASHDMAEGEFGDAGFPAADEVIGTGFYGPVVSIAVVLQCEGVPASGDGVGNTLPSGSFFVSVPGAVCISTDTEVVIGIKEPIYPQLGVPLNASCIFQSGVVHRKASSYLFLFGYGEFYVCHIRFFGGDEFHRYIQGADAFHLFQPLLQAADVQDVSRFDGKCVFPWDDGAVFLVDDFMQPSDMEVEKEFPVSHILLGDHDAAGHISPIQQFRIQVFYQPVDG